ncbi:MAG: AmmeMemoRadiSam system radical SAM enzyme [Candidatus Omnitrophica bacterium]|nr:AmmeMemoRadiSam system radical SAM enzyme [Candidatus Omnitrophota bacterium]
MEYKEALYYEILPSGKIHCLLCPQSCVIEQGRLGFCRVRKNIQRKLYTLIYGQAASISLDSIEKKPLYHYHPGEYILSVGTKGCNFSCPFCQNWSISQDDSAQTETITSHQLVEKAKELDSFGIAYTYNEPFIWYEFVLETAELAKSVGLENVLVTNGYVNLKPLEEILPFIHAMNIDLKSIDEEFYRKVCNGRLNPVLEVIKRSHKACHIELTNLIIPNLNDSSDSLQKLVDWIYDNLGSDVPLHFSRYFPNYKLDIPPTPVDTLKKAEQIARKKLKFVYLGNVR